MHKKREERVKVLARARMRNGTAWSDVCLVNLSSRGAGLQCASSLASESSCWAPALWIQRRRLTPPPVAKRRRTGRPSSTAPPHAIAVATVMRD